MNQYLVAALLACATVAAQAEVEAPVYDMVSLQADARASVPNDLMHATLFVELDNKDPATLAAEVTRTVNQATKIAQGIRNLKLTTGAQSTWPVHDTKNKVVAWRSRAELRLESRDFDAMARAIAQMQAGMQLANVNFSLAPETANSSENGLIETAMTAFRTRADLIAKSLGAKSWRIVNLNVSAGNEHPPMPFMRAMAMKSEAADMPVQDMEGGDSQITVTLNGTIQLQP